MLRFLFFYLGICTAYSVGEFKYQTEHFAHVRNKRFLPLIFTNTSTITFITGFGIPVHNLNPELVTVGMVLKAQQYLPTTYESLRRYGNHSIYKRERTTGRNNNWDYKRNSLQSYRSIFYETLEQLSISMGQAGHTCVLKMICEMANLPFHYQNGILGEIVHILLTPTSTTDVHKTQKDFNYLEAEHLGRRQFKCHKLFKDCKETILNLVTEMFD